MFGLSLHHNGMELLRQFKFNKKTSNGYLVAFKSFCNWLVKDGHSSSNPVAHLSRINAKSDARIVRRAAMSDELARLIEAAEHGPTIRGLAGPDRAMLYRVATGTGFRADQLASLKASSFNLNSAPATITTNAAYNHSDLVRKIERRKDRESNPGESDLTAQLMRNDDDCDQLKTNGAGGTRTD